MSSGGNYILLTSNQNINNRQDKYLQASKRLNNRINDINNNKKYQIENDINELKDCIDKWSNEYVNEQKKGRKILINSHLKKLNKKINEKKMEGTYPVINDITKTHHLFLNSKFKPFVTTGYEYSKQVISPIPNLNSTVKIEIKKFGDFFNDMVVYIKLVGLKPINPINKVKYATFLAHRLFKKVRFIINNIIIDEYTSEDYNFHYQFKVPDYKKNAWKRCVGQEVGLEGTIVSDPVYQNTRQQITILDGPQTSKFEHPIVELCVPLLFWFQDHKLSVPNTTLPFGQTFIEIDLATKDEIAASLDYASDGGAFESPQIIDFHLYTNHIYINPDILDIFIKRLDVTLIRVHKQQEIILNQSFGEILLNELKYPIETLYLAFRPTNNFEGDDRINTWHKNSQITRSELNTPVIFDTTGNGDLSIRSGPIIYYTEIPVVELIGLSAQGVDIYQPKPTIFYNSYLPYQYGNTMSVPHDKSTYIITFNFDPNAYQPTGYLNLTTIRRFYLSYNSSFINASNTCKLIVSATVINFLLLQNGKLTLTFNT